MNNKMPRKYLIIGVILILPEEIVWLGSLLTPYNLIGHPLFVYGAMFSLFCAVGVDIYGMYFASKLNKKGISHKNEF
ncbi:MAG: hypothetical protein AMDU4_FER2C00018G0024 [Ferroplasma sp. Type II]|jgi:hypothetical protein|uniref:hypothetical protein n=1 Tax=Ferroplasma sp. Type II TaxID=261388 RepID=UPI0003895761|nr:hypothetical protein [Ferroplasma sp. Type II]EQB74260.1 MAG: hypothetical protein AMDU4_FER2C00018G0024 [Ferroplasma sp. Type II]HIH59938.1 hypothetical protein [Ferroplasma sp.]HII82222.1 hypothetical protein [Ferroplasma sp.]